MLPVVHLLTLLGASPAPLPGEAVVRRAYDLYGGKWFHRVTFVQRTVLPLETRMETWYVALQVPGMVRIDVAPPITGRAVLYRNDSTYEFGKGQLRVATPGVQPLLVLMHDLHAQSPAKTIGMLKHYGFDLSKTYQRSWNGLTVIVVGARAGDSTSNQFWLEKNRMLLVRLIEQNGSDPRRPLDAQVGAYQRAGEGWLEHHIQLALGGEISTVEDYTDVKVDPPLDRDVFEPLPYHLPAWVGSGADIFGHVPSQLPQGVH